MTLAAFQSAWGKAYKFYPLKTAFLCCISIFEIGSLIVAVAPNSPTVIAGRAIQGVGGAGITGGIHDRDPTPVCTLTQLERVLHHLRFHYPS